MTKEDRKELRVNWVGKFEFDEVGRVRTAEVQAEPHEEDTHPA